MELTATVGTQDAAALPQLSAALGAAILAGKYNRRAGTTKKARKTL